MKPGLAGPLAAALAGCAHWGTASVPYCLPQSAPVSTYLAPPRPALSPHAVVTATGAPPPPGSTVLAVSSVACDSSEEQGCLPALLDEARRLGGSGVYGAHFDYERWRHGSSRRLVGSVAFDPAATPAAPPTGRPTELQLGAEPGGASLEIRLERREADLALADGAALANWQLVCQLPCDADFDPGSSYRLTATELGAVQAVALAAPIPKRVHVVLREGAPDYGRVWWGVGLTLGVGAAVGGTTAYYFANRGAPAGVAELTVGLTLLPCLLLGLEDLLLGPVRRPELAIEPD